MALTQTPLHTTPRCENCTLRTCEMGISPALPSLRKGLTARRVRQVHAECRTPYSIPRRQRGNSQTHPILTSHQDVNSLAHRISTSKSHHASSPTLTPLPNRDRPPRPRSYRDHHPALHISKNKTNATFESEPPSNTHLPG